MAFLVPFLPYIAAAAAVVGVASNLQQSRTAKKAADQTRELARVQAEETKRLADEEAFRSTQLAEEQRVKMEEFANAQRRTAEEKRGIDLANVTREEGETAERNRRIGEQMKKDEAAARAAAAASGFRTDDDGNSIALALSTQVKENTRQLDYEKAAGKSRSDIGKNIAETTYKANIATAGDMSARAQLYRDQAAAAVSSMLGRTNLQSELTLRTGDIRANELKGQARTSLWKAGSSALSAVSIGYNWWTPATASTAATTASGTKLIGDFPTGPTYA